MAIQVVIDGYDSLEQIGIGGMAAVYKARKVSIDKVVAIKLLFPYLAGDESYIERFQREAKAAASVQHENIVNVIDFGECGGSYYIVMEYYDGQTLEDLLKSPHSMPVDVAISILLEVCYGLEAAHNRGIVHRDIKPGNIIYTKSGGIKIADFGLAKKSDGATMITQAGKVIGTPAYMSPEQAAGANVGPASDTFSLGVVAYELLGHSKPFMGNSYSEVLESIQTCEPPCLSNVNPLIQPHFEHIVRRMLEKDEAQRYGSVSEVIAELEKGMDKAEITRDRRRLTKYIAAPQEYEKRFREKVINQCLSQGTFYMKKGQSHLDEAILEFKRILHLDPENKRARKYMSKLVSERGKVEQERTREVSAIPDKRVKVVAGSARKRKRHGFKRTAITALIAAELVVMGYFGYQKGYFDFALPGDGNKAPALSAPRQMSVMAGEVLSFSLQAVDAEGDDVTFSAQDLPNGAKLSNDGDFSWKVGRGQEGSHAIVFEASDGTGSAAAVTQVEVSGVANKIDFDPIRNATLSVGQRMSRELRSRTTTGREPNYVLVSSPAEMFIKGSKLQWKANKAGNYSATVRAVDGEADATRTFTLTVTEKKKRKVAVKTGTVVWALPENANIYVDGALKARNAKQLKADLSAGPHTLLAELSDGVTGWSQVVSIKGGQKSELKAEPLTYGKLSVYFLGGVGEFRINGKRFQSQPPFSEVKIPVGTHAVSCRFESDGAAHEFSIEVKKGRETVVEYEPGNEPVVTIEG